MSIQKRLSGPVEHSPARPGSIPYIRQDGLVIRCGRAEAEAIMRGGGTAPTTRLHCKCVRNTLLHDMCPVINGIEGMVCFAHGRSRPPVVSCPRDHRQPQPGKRHVANRVLTTFARLTAEVRQMCASCVPARLYSAGRMQKGDLSTRRGHASFFGT